MRFKWIDRTEFDALMTIRTVYNLSMEIYSHTLKSHLCDASFKWTDRTEFIREMAVITMLI